MPQTVETNRLAHAAARLCAAAAIACLTFGCDNGEPEPQNPEAARWIEQLRVGDVQQRQEAIGELAKLEGPAAVNALLTTARTDNQWNLRVEAIRALDG